MEVYYRRKDRQTGYQNAGPHTAADQQHTHSATTHTHTHALKSYRTRTKRKERGEKVRTHGTSLTYCTHEEREGGGRMQALRLRRPWLLRRAQRPAQARHCPLARRRQGQGRERAQRLLLPPRRRPPACDTCPAPTAAAAASR